jgi:hypothetical protein
MLKVSTVLIPVVNSVIVASPLMGFYFIDFRHRCMHRNFKLTLAGDGKNGIAPPMSWDATVLSGENVNIALQLSDFGKSPYVSHLINILMQI